MTTLRVRIKEAKVDADMVWFHTAEGWISISKHAFDKFFEKDLMAQLYYRHNKSVERKIEALEHERKSLSRKEDKEAEIKRIESEIHVLRGQLKKELHYHDLAGKVIVLKM